MICPSCRQDVAPIVRGVRSYCTSCGAQMPFDAAPEAVNVAGQPAKVGSGIVRVLGSLVLAGGFVLAAILALIASAISATPLFYVAGFFAVVATIIATPLFFAGKKLSDAGDEKKRAAAEKAVFALAAQRRGVLTASVVSRALEIHETEADALLTALAKDPDGRVSLEVDDNCTLTYVFRDLVASTSPASRVRISDRGWRAPAPPAEPKARVVDAEIVDEEASDEVEAPRRMTR